MLSSSLVFREYATRSPHLRQRQSYRQTNYRYLALFLACMIMLGDAYCFDNPMALQTPLQNQFHISNFQFNLLYTVYSLPNIILPFFGGLLIDKIGSRLGILIFSTIILLGQIVCYMGVQFNHFWLLIVGRVIFGMGSESLNTAQNSIMAQWFKNKEMSFAIGLCISIPKIGSAFNSIISPLIAESKAGSVAEAFLAGVGFILLSYISGLFLIFMDKESDKRERQQKMLLENLFEETVDNQLKFGKKKSNVVPIDHERIFSDKERAESEQIDEQKQNEEDKNNTVEDENENNEEIEKIQVGEYQASKQIKHEIQENHEHENGESEVEEIKLADIAKMPGTFWIVLIICMLTEALFVPFLDNGNDFFQVRFGFSQSEAGYFLIIPYLMAALITPFFGALVDKLGRRDLLIILTALIFLGTHLLLLTLTCSQMCFRVSFPLFMLGMCFAFYSSVVIPSIPVVVKPNLIGTAFGLMGVFQNTALALFPMITGTLFSQFSERGSDPERGYEYQSLFFVGMSVFLLFISIALLFVDKAGGKILSKSGVKKEYLETNATPQLQAAKAPNENDQE